MRRMIHPLMSMVSVRAAFSLSWSAAIMWGLSVASCLLCSQVRADNAVSVNSQGLPIAFVSISQSLGWRFSVNTPIQVTSLGLLDANNDGFQTDHPIAIWNGKGEMLAEAVVHAGAVEPLINRFRYGALAPQDQVILTPGDEYTIGYFTTPDASADGFVVFNGTHTMHPALTQIGAQFFAIGENLQLPESPNPLGSQCFGPGFQFNIVPGPSTVSFLVLAMTAMRRRRR